MAKTEKRERFEQLSVESSGAYTIYVRSTNDLWRAIVRALPHPHLVPCRRRQAQMGMVHQSYRAAAAAR